MNPPLIHALFINSGILGQKTFAHFVQHAFAGQQEGIRATQIVLTEGLTLGERLLRRLLCLRLWSDGWGGMTNLDLMRYRAEWHAGLLTRRRIRRLGKSGERFDVLHFHRQATAYASLGRIRTTPTIISIDCTQRCALQSARNQIEARTYRPNVRRDGHIFCAAKLIISTSRWAANCLREEYPDCATEIAIMPSPVELDAFDPTWVEERYTRAVQTPGYQPRVLFMGGDFRRKGGDDLLSAWREGQLGRRARLDLATSWPIAPERLPPEVNIHARIAAHSPEWRSLWREADIFVLPTRDEAFGAVFQEAAAAGVPAIGTRINAVPETIHEGKSGFLVTPSDRDALIRALNQLISSADLRRRMGARAREFIVRSAHPDAYRQKLVAAIQNLAKT
jgi:glycosyltransferase involved in cell wall biosynthesis